MQRIVKYKGLRLGLLLTFLITLISVGAEAADKNEEHRLLEDLKTGNHIALMRHALAPGTGDPENFMLGDIENLESGCSENGYGDFTGLSTVLEGSSIHTVMFSCGFGSQQVSLWIDLDQDYQFEPDCWVN